MEGVVMLLCCTICRLLWFFVAASGQGRFTSHAVSSSKSAVSIYAIICRAVVGYSLPCSVSLRWLQCRHQARPDVFIGHVIAPRSRTNTHRHTNLDVWVLKNAGPLSKTASFVVRNLKTQLARFARHKSVSGCYLPSYLAPHFSTAKT